jgi:DNA modification methylase
MKPYYQDDYVTLYHGDCLEITAWTEADVLVTDPPYGIGWKAPSGWTNSTGGGGHRSTGMATSIEQDADTSTRDAAMDLWGTKPGVVFGDFLRPAPRGSRQVCIYAKPFDSGIRGTTAGFRRDAEAIFLTGSWPSGVGGRTSILHTNGYVAGPRGIATRAGHPHAKPLDVLEHLIGVAPDGVIADPFAGSGSTLIAASNLGRKSIGVELEERYCELIAKRLDQMCIHFAAGVLE